MDKLEVIVCLEIISELSVKQIMDNPDYIREVAKGALKFIQKKPGENSWQ